MAADGETFDPGGSDAESFQSERLKCSEVPVSTAATKGPEQPMKDLLRLLV